ncbi:uncharacterized protein BP5553_06492 [Venustampulla echinocandica]|uniref:Calcium-transporting ATPase n=1 Tax=Venustampulla echinocandica TaxID=2656787 RepID=A0A370TK29_9HELO|nr:uncharacterized protein BP5553_06492 [Venustampulla echinocandica]RDL35880.1 hypothetical protein BP5553_06492 [Venustampulla echinocandica]
MADTTNGSKGYGTITSPSARNGPARQWAPTITIDTFAVGPPSNDQRTTSGDRPPSPASSAASAISSTARQRSLSLEYQPLLASSWRPATSQSISSHTSEPRGLSPDGSHLAVPDIRSRASSIDRQSLSSYGGETHLTTPSLSDPGNSRAHSRSGSPVAAGNDDPLKPHPGEEADFHVENNVFAFSPGQLSKLFDHNGLGAFYSLGGLEGLVRGLRTDSACGLSLDESKLEGTVDFETATGNAPTKTKAGTPHEEDPCPPPVHAPHRGSPEPYGDRKRVFGSNRLPEKTGNTLLQIMWVAFNDKVLIILTVVAAISLALGLYQDFGQSSRYGGPKVRWVEGVTIMTAVVIVVIVGSVNDFQKEQQFIKLNRKKADRVVKVIRSGKSLQISVYDVVAGDVLHIEPGDLIPADGILISGNNVKCDESSITGESDQKRKCPGEKVVSSIEGTQSTTIHAGPFIISGSKVLEGTGTYLVTSVGLNSSYGKMIMAVMDDSEATPTPLQTKLSIMAEQITRAGCAIALILFIVLFAKFLANLGSNPGTPAEKAQDFLQIVIVTITIIVIAVPEGLPLAVTLALAFAMTNMLKENNLVRVLSSCETMGNATTICSDKTGTLTTNKMTAVAGQLGMDCRFASNTKTPIRQQEASNIVPRDAEPMAMSEVAPLLSSEAKDLLVKSITINSTAFEGIENGQSTFIGSKTETALLLFAQEHLAMASASEEREKATVVQVFPFDSARKYMAVVTKQPDGTYRMYVKGASEILLDTCTRVITDITGPVQSTPLTQSARDSLNRTMVEYTTKSLRTMSLIYRDFESFPPPGARILEDDPTRTAFDDVLKDMVFLGIIGIQDPIRLGVQEAVAKCQHAGVVVRMVTGDNVNTASAIAQECGIYDPRDGILLQGPEFRRLPEPEMDQIIPKLRVLARSSPEDKRVLVKRLKSLGETVAVTGDGTNDGPALRAADVGFSMGISGTEVAKEVSSIILLDDNFSSIVRALEWGRAVNDSVRKFLQFQLTVNITAVGITFVSAVADPREEPILTPVQLLWVNLIMDTFAALALATDPPTPSLLDRKPDRKTTRLITLDMWKMIIGQSIYQLIVTLVLNFRGNEIFGYTTPFEQSRLETLVFNIYVWMQIFNQLNNRRLDRKLNIFEGISRNWFFIGINIITVSGQAIIIFAGSSALSTIRLDAKQWGITLIFGLISLPIGILIRLIPNEFIRACIPASFCRNDTDRPRPTPSNEERFEWNDAVQDIRDQLTLFKHIRGGPFQTLTADLLLASRQGPSLAKRDTDKRYGDKSKWKRWMHIRPRQRRRSKSVLGPAAAMAGVVAGSIAGWGSPPTERSVSGGSDGSNSPLPPNQSSTHPPK